MKHIKTFESFVNESLRSSDLIKGPNDAYTYPIKKSDNPEHILSGNSPFSWIARSTAYDLLNVFGEEMSIYKGDGVVVYFQVNSKDSHLVYKIVRRDLRGSRIAGYIPSIYRDFDQAEAVEGTI